MKILALDTATECCSVALWLDGEVSTRERNSAREHAALVLPMVHELLGEAGLSLAALDCLACGRGPGGFTGVRIGVGLAQGLAYGAALPVMPVSNLTALAEGARREHGAARVLAVLDARMQETYWAAVRFAGADHTPELVLPERLSAPEAIVLPDREERWIGAGPGWAAYAEALAPLAARLSVVDARRFPHAADIAALAARAWAAGQAPVEPREVLPVYLRDRVARRGP